VSVFVTSSSVLRAMTMINAGPEGDQRMCICSKCSCNGADLHDGICKRCKLSENVADVLTLRRVSQALCESRACAARGVAATHGKMCVHCAQRAHEGTRINMLTPTRESRAARARMDAMDRRQAPPLTATQRELAKGHPASWPSQEGEPDGA